MIPSVFVSRSLNTVIVRVFGESCGITSDSERGPSPVMIWRIFGCPERGESTRVRSGEAHSQNLIRLSKAWMLLDYSGIVKYLCTLCMSDFSGVNVPGRT